jgi:hypothetical protein
MLSEVAGRVKAPIALDWKHRDAPATVVGRHGEPAGSFDAHVAWATTPSRLAIEERQATRRWVDGERADSPALAPIDFRHGIDRV